MGEWFEWVLILEYWMCDLDDLCEYCLEDCLVLLLIVELCLKIILVIEVDWLKVDLYVFYVWWVLVLWLFDLVDVDLSVVWCGNVVYDIFE